MGLVEALLLDPYRMDIYVANRTDGVQGSGTQNDPFNGSTISTAQLSVTSLTRSGQIATATTSTNHGFVNGQLILVLGATLTDSVYYNGIFSIFNVTATTFQYTMWGTPGSSPATGTITAQANPYQLDGVMRSLPISVASVAFSGTTATVTAINHGFTTSNQVLIAGATGSDASKYNGTFSISTVTPNTFQYTMSGTPGANAVGVISCRLNQSAGVVVALPVTPPVAVHLGPGTFQTNGYADGANPAWQARPGMKISGSGVDVTVLQLAGNATNAHYYGVGHAVGPGGQPNSLDLLEVSDLTVDCNLQAYTGGSTACGAVRVLGNHAKVRRLKVKNWGTGSVARPCFVVSVITATDLAWVEDCGIEDCIAVNPSGSSASGSPITIFHAGAIEVPQAAPQGYGVAPYIRNCFADSGQAFPFSCEFRGLSLAWCKAGITEGNQIHNTTFGVFQQPTAAQDVVIRNNWFKNVKKGVLLGNTGAMSGTGGLSKSGSVATVTILSGHNLSIGDFALLTTSGAYNGIVITVQPTSFTSTVFTFNTSNSAGSDTNVSVQKVFGIGNSAGLGNFTAPGSLTIEGNVIELVTATSGSGIIGIHLNDSWVASSPLQDPTYPTYVFARVVVRDNKLRYTDGVPYSSFVGYGMQLNSAMDLLVRNNVVETIPTPPPPPVQNDRCGAVGYFNNLTPAGVLIPGINGDNSSQYEELSTLTDFALIMGLFNRRA